MADKEAQHGANLPLESHAKQMSVAGAKRWAHTTANQDFSTYQISQPTHHRLRPDCARLQAHAELRLPRKSLARLLAARSGYGNFAAYHARFNHPDAEKRCRCGAHTTPTHFYYCRHSSHKELLKGKQRQPLTIKELLRTIEGALPFSHWVKILNFFETSSRPR